MGLGLFTDVALAGAGKAFSNQNNPVSMDENRNNAAAFRSIDVESIIWSPRQHRTGQIWAVDLFETRAWNKQNL